MTATDLSHYDPAPATPPVVDQQTWQAELEELRSREKAVTTASSTPSPRSAGTCPWSRCPTTRSRVPSARCAWWTSSTAGTSLIVYSHMWHPGAEFQCGGCTFFSSQFARLEYLGNYDACFVVVTQGPIDEALAYRRRVGNPMSWYSTAESTFGADVGAPPDAGYALNDFLRDGEDVYRTWHTDGRGLEGAALLRVRPHGCPALRPAGPGLAGLPGRLARRGAGRGWPGIGGRCRFVWGLLIPSRQA